MKRLDGVAELRRLAGQLLEGGFEAVADLHVPASECLEQLVLVVAGDTESVAVGNHSHDQAEHAGGVRAAVDQVTDEDGPPVRVYGVDRAAGVVAGERVAEVGEQSLELGPAAVHVADDVERTGLIGAGR